MFSSDYYTVSTYRAYRKKERRCLLVYAKERPSAEKSRCLLVHTKKRPSAEKSRCLLVHTKERPSAKKKKADACSSMPKNDRLPKRADACSSIPKCDRPPKKESRCPISTCSFSYRILIVCPSSRIRRCRAPYPTARLIQRVRQAHSSR